MYILYVCTCKSHIERGDGLSHIELIHVVDNDGRSGEESEQQNKKEVKHHIAHVPANTLLGEIGPVRCGKNTGQLHKKIQSEENIMVSILLSQGTKLKCFNTYM